MKNNTHNIILAPKNKKATKRDRIIRFEDKSQDFLDGYIQALEEITEGYNIYLEKVV